MTRLFNTPSTANCRRELRRRAVGTERMLWARLRGRQVAGLRFRRQYGVGAYVLDFYCPAVGLGIEVDGAGHYEGDAPKRDAERTVYLEACGLQVVRFSNAEVLANLDGVVEAILAACMSRMRKQGV